jgi:hypothetical protein
VFEVTLESIEIVPLTRPSYASILQSLKEPSYIHLTHCPHHTVRYLVLLVLVLVLVLLLLLQGRSISKELQNMSPILSLGVRTLPVDLIKAWDMDILVCGSGSGARRTNRINRINRTNSFHVPFVRLHQLVVLRFTHRTFNRLLHKIQITVVKLKLNY